MGIIINHVNYIYSRGTAYEKQALRDIQLKIEDGEFVGLIGHTGSGKSTLIQHLNGLMKATDGEIFFNGEDIYDKEFDMRRLRSKVGLVFQYPEHQLFETSVIRDVKFGPSNLDITPLEADLRSYEALKQVGIPDDLLDASPFELSGGQKRRVAIAGVLAMKPEVLILDEPTAGLDPCGRDEILNLLKELHENNHLTVILVSHSMEDVAKYADRLVVMDHGSIVFDDVPKKVFSYYKELERIGLAAPQVTYVLNALKERGLPVRTDATTIEEAAREILRFLKERKGGE